MPKTTGAELLKAAGIDNADLAKSIDEALSSAETLNTGNMVPRTRLNEEIKKLTDANARISELEAAATKSTADNEALQKRVGELAPFEAEVKQFREQQTASVKAQHAEMLKAFDVKEGDKTFAAVQKAMKSGHFVFAEKDKELTTDQMQANLAAFKIYTDAGGLTPAAAQGTGVAPVTTGDGQASESIHTFFSNAMNSVSGGK